MAATADIELQTSLPTRLNNFIADFETLIWAAKDEAEVLAGGSDLLRQLVENDDWLPAKFAEANPNGYRQYLLHKDPQDRFSVVSFVWGPGQSSPIHNHTVWGLIGMLRGSEIEQHYVLAPDGTPVPEGNPHTLHAGQVDAVSPSVGDIHRVSNARSDSVSISIHAYGANIGEVQRSAYEPDGAQRSFVSGYSPTDIQELPA